MPVTTVVAGRLRLQAIPSTDTCNVLRLKFSDIWARMITVSGIQEARESTCPLELAGGCPPIAVPLRRPLPECSEACPSLRAKARFEESCRRFPSTLPEPFPG